MDTDSVHYKKLKYKEYFGELGSKEKIQFYKLFKKRFLIDTTKVWLVNYLESLLDIKNMPQNSKMIFLDHKDRPYRSIPLQGKSPGQIHIKMGTGRFAVIDLTKYRHKKMLSNEDFKKNILNERSQYKKIKNVELLYFYNFNNGYPEKDVISDGWLKDSNLILKKVFSPRDKTFSTIILHPDGNFCLNPTGYKRIKKLLNTKSYLNEKRKWKKSYDRLN